MKKFLAVLIFFALTICSFSQVGTFSANLDSLELMDATTATHTRLARVGTTDYYACVFRDAASDGQLYTFSCTSTGAIGAAVTDSWEFLPDASLDQYFGIAGAEWADGYLAVGYGNNGANAVVTIPIGTDGAITESFTSTYNIPGVAASACPGLTRITGTNYYLLNVGRNAPGGLVIISLQISEGTISFVDSLNLTKLDSRYHLNHPCRVANTNYFVLGKATAGAGSKSGLFSFECDVSNGQLGAAPIDSLAVNSGGIAGGAHNVYMYNDSTLKSTSVIMMMGYSDNNAYVNSHGFTVNPANGDLLANVEAFQTGTLQLGGPTMTQSVGDDWVLVSGSARSFMLKKCRKSDGDFIGATYDFTKQYAPTTSVNTYTKLLSFSTADSTAYFLYATGGKDSDAWVHTFSVKGGRYAAGRPGKINTVIIDSTLVCTNTSGTVLDGVRMGTTGSVFAVGYVGADSDPLLKTFTCTNTGSVSEVVDSLLWASTGACTEISIDYTGGNYVGMVYEQNTLGYLGSLSVNSSTGEVGASATSLKIAGGNILYPKIFRIQSSNYHAVVYGIYGNGGSTDAGWLKTYTINSSDGSLGPSGTTTLAAADSIKISTGYYAGTPSMCRIASTDYYALVVTSTASKNVKLYTIEINSTTGAIGNTWIDSLAVKTTASVMLYSSIQRMGTVNNFYIISAAHGSAVHYSTVEISGADGTIAAAVTDSWDITTIVTQESNLLAIGGDIYLNIVSGKDTDGYIRTIEADDTTGFFQPPVTNDYYNEFEFQQIGIANSVLLGKLSAVNAGNYQTTYFLFATRSGAATVKTYLYTLSAMGEPDEYGWAHKIWNLTFGKLWGIARSAVKKVFGL